MLIKILGCGPSVGVPVIGCRCNICVERKPMNCRTRSAILVEHNDTKILIDFGVDIKNQLLRENISNLSAVILTHDHADHVNGIDDLKVFSFINKKPLKLYSDHSTISAIEQRFSYMFKSPDKNDFWGNQRLETVNIDFDTTIEIEDLKIQFFRQHHGRIDSLGIRIGNFVYSNDLVSFPKSSYQYLYNIDTWIIDCLESNTTLAHAGLSDIKLWVEQFKPKKVFLTDMDHSMDYYELINNLPSNISPAYDGLHFEVD